MQLQTPSRGATRIADEAAALFRPSGRFAYQFARGKLLRDPLFAALLRSRAIPDAGRLVDLGCGQGLLAAWLATARGDNAADATAPATPWYHGIDRSSADLARARRALPASFQFRQRDLARITAADLGRCEVVTLFDVLHYLAPQAQQRLLAQVHAALADDGVLVLRVGDSAVRRGSRWSGAIDCVVSAARGHPLARLYRRPLAAWLALLDALGFAPTVLERHEASTFANVLIRATKRTPSSPDAGREHRLG